MSHSYGTTHACRPSYPDDDTAEANSEVDREVDIGVLEADEDLELTLPSGAKIGHRYPVTSVIQVLSRR